MAASTDLGGSRYPASIVEIDVLPISQPPNFSRAFRAVSPAEFDDISQVHRFREYPGSLEGKWFADSVEGALAHAATFYPDGHFSIFEADLPDDAPSLFRQENLDGKGPARYLHVDDLKDVIPRLWTH